MDHDNLNLTELKVPYLETTIFGDYTIKIEHDDIQQESPREWEPLGTMVCWHKRNSYGDIHNYHDHDEFFHTISELYTDLGTIDLTGKQLARCKKTANEKNIILSLYLYDHSGVSISTTPFSCPFDSGHLGFIYVSREDVRKEYSVGHVSQKRHKEVIGYFKNEVKVYNQYLNGEIFWFNIEKTDEDGDTDEIDSCGGYFGYDNEGMISVIKDAIKNDITQSSQQTEMF